MSGVISSSITRFNHNFLPVYVIVFVHEFPLVNNLFFEKFSVARIHDFNFTHHLAYNNFKVLVVDFHTLHTIYFLNFVYNIFLNFSNNT